MSYKDLSIYKESFDLFIRTHKFSLRLPSFEKYELGSQLRRSSDSVNSNIVEGYGRKKYEQDFIRFLIMALSSNDETINHLLKIEVLYPDLKNDSNNLVLEYNLLGKKLYRFIEHVAATK